jgi:hypothetical protein
MRTYLGQTVTHTFRRSPHVGRAVVFGLCGSQLGLLAAGIILQIDNTANVAHMSTTQGIIGALAMIVLVAVLVVSWMRAWFEFRGFALLQTGECLVVRLSWAHRVMINASLVQGVALTLDPGHPNMQVAELILRDGHQVLIPLARQRVGHHGHASGIQEALAPLGDLTAATPTINTTIGTRDTLAPGSAVLNLSDRIVKSRRRSATTFWSAATSAAVIAGIRARLHNASGLVAIFLGVMLFFAGIRFFILRQMPQEVSITATSLSVKRYFQRRWLTFNHAAMVCVSHGQAGKHQTRVDGLYIYDAIGQRVVLSSTWLASDLAVPLRALLLDHPATTAAARSMLSATS